MATVLKNFLNRSPLKKQKLSLIILFASAFKYNKGMKKIFYRVQSGDSVQSVAERFGTSPTLLIKDNNLTCDIEAGDLLIVQPVNGVSYKVQPTDTLVSLSEKFGVPQDKI